MKSTFKSMLIVLFDIKGILNKEFARAGQIVNSAYRCEGSRRLQENVRRLRLEIWRQKNWRVHHDNGLTHPFSSGNFFLPKT
jgi:hypothetical protein